MVRYALLIVLFLGACVEPPQATYCGDGIVQQPNDDGIFEECDDGDRNDVPCTPQPGESCEYCTASCRIETVHYETVVSEVLSPWVSEDIGEPLLAGNATYDDGLFVIEAAGRDIWHEADEFHFVYQEITGDFEIIGEVLSLEETDWSSKVGLMVRASLMPESRNAYMYLNILSRERARFSSRTVDGGNTSGPTIDAQMPYWIRIVRVGDTLVGFVSDDGADWIEVGRVNMPLGEAVYAGIAVTSRDEEEYATAQMRNLEIVSYEEDLPEEPAPIPGEHTPADYYVATDGSDVNDGRAPETAFRTISHAAKHVGPGDTVRIREGTYNEKVALTQSGTSDDPIVFEAFPGETVIIDGLLEPYEPGDRGTDTRTPPYAVLMQGDWIILRDLTITNSNHYGLQMTGDDLRVEHVIVHSNRHNGIHATGRRYHIEDTIAHSNQQPNCGYREDRGSCQQSADGFGLRGSDGRCVRCIAYNNADDGFDLHNAAGRIVIEDSVAFGNGFDEGNGNGFKMCRGDRSSCTVRTSIAFHNLRRGFTDQSGNEQFFEHNTAFDNGRGFRLTGTSHILTGNLAYAESHPVDDRGSSDMTYIRNSWQLDIDDPQFESTNPLAEGFLALSSESPARGAGEDATDLGALPYGVRIGDLLGDLADVIVEAYS